MSEYIEVDYELTADPNEVEIYTNLNLTPNGGREVYRSLAEGDEGTPLAQALFSIPGIEALTLNGDEMVVRREPDIAWHDLIEDIRDVLIDFFL